MSRISVRAFISALVVYIFVAASPAAGDDGSRWSLHLRTGLRQATFNKKHQPWAIAPAVDFKVYFRAGTALSIGAAFSYSKIYDDSLSTKTFKIGNGNASAYWRSMNYGIVGRYLINPGEKMSPYFEFGLGISNWTINRVGTDEPLVVSGSGGDDKDLKASEFYLLFAVGAESFIHSRWSIHYGLELLVLTKLGADFDQTTEDYRSHGLASAYVGLGFHFGPRKKSLWERWRESEAKREGGQTQEQKIVPPDANAQQLPDTIGKVYVDSDSDGVRDELDLCGDTPPEAAAYVDENGCPTDQDMDGVADYLDRCFNTPVGMAVDSVGCALDADGDGVADIEDECPDSPKGYPVNRSGCVEKAQLFAKRTLHIIYPPGGSNLDRNAREYLDTLAMYLADFRDVTVRIYGYTDNVGEEEANLTLSQKRADKIKGYLVLQGIDQNRIVAIGRGETDFVASNSDKYGREKNRRIELEFEF